MLIIRKTMSMSMVFRSTCVWTDYEDREDSYFSISFIFGFRTSDGGKVVGTIEVSGVKMGEMEDGEADHITTDVQGQKVKGLSKPGAHMKLGMTNVVRLLNH